jgi:tRNA(Ile2) C34 agmatinyltransferase TiaS
MTCPCHDTFTVESAPDLCPRCGGTLAPDVSEFLLRCSDCDRQWPPRVTRPERPLYEAETLGAMEPTKEDA